MPWQIAIILHNLLGGSRSIVNRLIGKQPQDLSLYALIAGFFCVFCGGVLIAVLSGSGIDHQAAWSVWYYLLATGILFAILNYLNLKMYRILPASIASILSMMNPLSVVLVAAMLTTEVMSAQQWAGSSLLLAAVLLVSYFTRSVEKGNKSKKQMKVSKGLVLAILVAVLFGFGIVTEKLILDRTDIYTYVVYGWGAQFIGVSIVTAVLFKSFRLPKKNIGHLYVWLHGLLLVSSGYFFVFSLVNSDSSSLSAVSASAKVMIAVVLAYIFLKERSHMLIKITSVFVSTVGLYLLFS